MPTYRVNKLNISLADQAQNLVKYCTWGTTGWWSRFCCRWGWSPINCWTYITDFDPCRFTVSEWTGCGPHSPVVQWPDDILVQPAEQLAQLEQMRDQLTQMMAMVEERGVALERQAGPQTLEEAEMLEAQLKEALKEVQSQKKNLK